MFDEALIEQIEDIILDESLSLNYCKYLSSQIESTFLQVDDAWPYDDADVGGMIQCLKSLTRASQKKHRPKLKKTKNKLERLHAKMTKRLSLSNSPVKRTH